MSGGGAGPGSVAVIIVNYGTAALAVEAVESVLASDAGGRAVEVHLVDNAAPGDDAAALARAHAARGWGGRVTLWPQARNLGFGRGNNVVLEALAARAAAPDWVFLLNPDARLENAVLAILAAELEADPRAAAAGTRIALLDDAPGASAFRFPRLAGELVQTLNLGPLNRLCAGWRVPLPPDHPAGPVDWVSGTAVMFRFAALREVGFFDPDFFLYFEETELQHRLRRAGWRALHVPRARIRHVQGAATGIAGQAAARRRQPDYVYRSRWLYHAKTRGPGPALATALLVVVAAGLNVVQRGLRGRAPTLPLGFFADHWRHGIAPLLRPGRPA